jgi:outer membrane biosynthesis protein TonB
MDGVNVRVDNLGRISATITLSENEANGAAIKNEFKGTTPDGGFHQPGMDVAVDNRSAKVDYDHSKVRLWESKAGAQDLYHVSAASNVDSITITIPGRDTPITLSREQILQAKQNAVAQETAKKEAADKAAAEPKAATETATPKASAPGAIPEPKKGAGSTAPTAEVPTEQPQAAVKKTEVAPPPATETVKPPEASPAAETPSAATSRQEYEEKLSVQAKEVESALRGNRGYLWNDPVEALWQPNLRRALDQFPSVEARAALVEQVGPEKLGVLIYSRKEFQAPGGAMDMILEPLQLKADTLKSTVDTIAYEFSRSLTGYDRPAIKAALSKLDSLEQDSPGASKLAAVHYSSKTGDNTPGTFDKAVETLRAAVASKAE